MSFAFTSASLLFTSASLLFTSASPLLTSASPLLTSASPLLTSASPLLSSSVIKSYKDPYDAYDNRAQNKQLSLIINGVIVEHLDTKLISVRWAIACAERVLPIFERWNSDDKRSRRAIEVAKLWVLEHTKATVFAVSDAAAAYEAAYDADAAYDATYSVAYATYDVNAHSAAHAAAAHAASTMGASRDAEIQWQRSQLKKIIKEHLKYYKKFNQLLCQRYPPELSFLILNVIN